MTEEVWNELHQCMDRYCITPTPSNQYDISHDYNLQFDVDPYSPTYEPLIKQAVQYKRAGNYDEAIKLYIKIFDDAKCFNTEIVRYLCKVLICDGELILAYKLLGASWDALRDKCGPCPVPSIPSIPWAQINDASQLVKACSELANTRDFRPFCAYVAPIAGNPCYVPTCNIIDLFMQAYMIAARH